MLDEKSDLEDIYHRRIVRHKGGGGGYVRPRISGGGDGGGFVILRTSKIKTLGNMSGSLQHTFRERETPNADEHRRTQNQVVIGPDNSDDVIQAWKDAAPEKLRKNGVIGIEYLVTGSPEAMARMSRSEQDEYFAKAIHWLKTRHGTDNILSAVIHRDETTPHLTAMVMPKDSKGKMNARHFLGGRQKLREMQTDFAERVGKAHGLERGIEGSKARHQRVRSYYAALERPPEASVSLPERRTGGLLGRGGESDEEYRQRAIVAATEALRQSHDRSHALITELQRQAAQDTGLMRGLKSERDMAWQEAQDAQQMGKTLYAVERVLSAMEREPGPVEQEAMAPLVQALDQLKVKPNAEIMTDISQRLKDLGYQPWSKQDSSRDDPGPEKTDPERSRDNGRDRSR